MKQLSTQSQGCLKARINFALGKNLNISPYNQNYETNIFALPPEPRAVANAIIGWKE